MKTNPYVHRSPSGFTLVEIMLSMAICVVVVGFAMSTLIAGLRMMYKDTQRLANNSALRAFLANISEKSLDSTEFYLLPNYTFLDGSVDLDPDSSTTSIAPLAPDAFGTFIAEGDCLILITRMTESSTANIRYIRIYYRPNTNRNTQAPLRFCERSYPGTPTNPGTPSSPTTLLNTINLGSLPRSSATNPNGYSELIELTLGRKNPLTADRYAMFSTSAPTPGVTQANVAINLEVINGTNANNQLSSSSFNYIISPRK